MDFVKPFKRSAGKNRIEIYPKFIVPRVKDIMIKGGDFYAFWDEERNQWSTSLDDLYEAIDKMLDKYYEDNKEEIMSMGSAYICHMWDGDSGSVDKWQHYVKKQQHDRFKDLDDTIVFLNDPYDRDLYSTHRLPYSMEEVETPCYDKLTNTLYSPEEKMKFEWAFGAIISGDSKRLQKFLVFNGAPGTGKSTIILIMNMLFSGYSEYFNTNAVGKGKDFSLETIAKNPLVAYDDDANLSKMEDNTLINKIVSHEPTSVNEKFKSQYVQRFKCMLFLCSNNDVNITDSRAGIIRRLIDVYPTGNLVSHREYNKLMDGIQYELGGIAKHCLQVYEDNKEAYDEYIPVRMMRSTNVVYSWLEENYDMLVDADGISVSQAWASYKAFCDECDIQYRLNRLQLQNELKGYFSDFIPDGEIDGHKVHSYYCGFNRKRFKTIVKKPPKATADTGWLDMKCRESIFDDLFAECPAQYATPDEVGKPIKSWDQNDCKLKDLKTSRLHYVRPPRKLIVIDFDLKNEGGGKDYILNAEAASKWPPTYAELSKSGAGIHLHYFYNGDISQLDSIVDEHIEVKTFSGKSSLRRMLTYCNDIPIATISSGLPLRKEKKEMVDMMTFKSQRHLLAFIVKQLRKETHADTHSSVSFIKKALNDAYASGMPYEVPQEMREDILEFAKGSTNHADDCIKMWKSMKWESEALDPANDKEDTSNKPIAFFDIEVYPNLLLVCFKEKGKACNTYINPEPSAIEYLFNTFRLVGFNNRKYDNHILYARFMGYSIYDCYRLSSEIIDPSKKDSEKRCFFREAYGKSYTDVYDYAKKKQSLKKWEIELRMNHKEMDLDWNKEVSDADIPRIIEYCCNDVEATEAVFDATQEDFLAREILAEITGMNVNTPTNTLTTRLIFGNDKDASDSLRWRDLSKPIAAWTSEATKDFLQKELCRFQTPFDEHSVLPYFPGYSFVDGVSTYRGYEVGEGGFVYAEPGMYSNVVLLDVESMHPNSFLDEIYAGIKYTRQFLQLVNLRLAIKHGDYSVAKQMFGGKLAKYLEDPDTADMLSTALKLAINSVYGLTSAKFQNAFYNKDNKDNIVAKRGALFMIDLLYFVQDEGFTVAHIKTDSIKIPNATNDIIDKVMSMGKKYGYNFEHEATYEKMCLVNDAVYVAKYLDADICQDLYGYIPSKNKKKSGKWTATGTQFQVPYVFKTLFSHEDILFEDMCETKSVTAQMYLDTNPDGEPKYEFVGKVGEFTPVKIGGGRLLRKTADKYSAVTDTKGYLWLQSSDAKHLDRSVIDESYYISKCNKARDAISKYGDFEWFVA